MSDNRNVLVAYFSCSGVTKKAAQALAKAAEADLYEIIPEIPYTKNDLNWNDSTSRSSIEMKDLTSRPAIKGTVEDIDKYDVVFIGFPIWWYIAPTIINTFLESYDFSGKTVIPFATSGSSGLGNAEDSLKTSCSNTTIWKSGRMLNHTSQNEIEKWVNSLDL